VRDYDRGIIPQNLHTALKIFENQEPASAVVRPLGEQCRILDNVARQEVALPSIRVALDEYEDGVAIHRDRNVIFVSSGVFCHVTIDLVQVPDLRESGLSLLGNPQPNCKTITLMSATNRRLGGVLRSYTRGISWILTHSPKNSSPRPS
jgi:hypothetical protein